MGPDGRMAVRGASLVEVSPQQLRKAPAQSRALTIRLDQALDPCVPPPGTIAYVNGSQVASTTPAFVRNV